MIRVGQGFDVHQLVEGRPCIIGGVTIPYEKGCWVTPTQMLLHAISDAILGALARGYRQAFPGHRSGIQGCRQPETT